MGVYQVNDLIAKWKLAKLTSEQAIGQILLLLQTIIERLEVIEQQGDTAGSPPRDSNKHISVDSASL